MDSVILATRRAQAINRIVETSANLAKSLRLDPVLVEALQPQVKDPQVKELKRLEALSELLTALAISAGAEKEPVTPAEVDLEPLPPPQGEDVTVVTADSLGAAESAEPAPSESSPVAPAESLGTTESTETAPSEASEVTPAEADLEPLPPPVKADAESKKTKRQRRG